MIPGDWEPYHRVDDGELIGYLVTGAEFANVVGKPLDMDDGRVLPVPTDRLRRS